MLDTESLLRPIREDAPTGENLRDDPSPSSPYYQIKDARNAARSTERAAQVADDPSAAPRADWGPVLELAPRLLSELSKDLEVAAWLIEALVREEGFEGLRGGFELVRNLVGTFWDGLHPLPDEDGMLTRVGPLTGLNGEEAEGTLIVPIGMVPLLVDDEGPLSAWHYTAARDLESVSDPEAKQRRIDAGAVTLERFMAAVAAADPAELFEQLAEVEACLEEFRALTSVMDERCGHDAPPTSNIRQALESVIECLRYLTRDLARPTASGEEAPPAATDAGGAAAPQQSAPGVVATREDAIEAMRRVRDYFRRTEPHSPLSYSLDQALRWAQLPLHVLVGELINDPSALASFQQRTGIPAGSESEQPSDF